MEFKQSIDNHNHIMKIQFYIVIVSIYVNNNNNNKKCSMNKIFD